jgi:hypothetical protein
MSTIKTPYTDFASRSGQTNLAGDALALFLRNNAGLLLEAWAEVNSFEGAFFSKTVRSGKSDVFPVIGRKREAFEHEPGELVIGGRVAHSEVEITLDPILVDSVFVAEIDELMNHYDTQAAYMRQLAESLSTTYDRRAATMGVLSSRVTTPPYTGGPTPGAAITHVNMATDMAQLENAFYTAVQRMKEQDVSGAKPIAWLRWAQYLALARYTGIDAEVTTGSGNRANATVGLVGGLQPRASNHLPSGNVTTGNTKYRGDFTKTVGLICNEMAVGILNLRGMKLQVTPQPDRLGNLIIASKAVGMGRLRPECAREIGTP